MNYGICIPVANKLINNKTAVYLAKCLQIGKSPEFNTFRAFFTLCEIRLIGSVLAKKQQN